MKLVWTDQAWEEYLYWQESIGRSCSGSTKSFGTYDETLSEASENLNP